VFETRDGKTDIEWTWITCFYFAMETVTTVGYGDITPGNDQAKIITIFVALIGVMVISQSLGTIANWFVEKNKAVEKQAQKKMLENAKKIAAGADGGDDGGDDGDDDGGGDKDDKEEETGPVIAGPPNPLIIPEMTSAEVDGELAGKIQSPKEARLMRRASEDPKSGKIVKKRKNSSIEPVEEPTPEKAVAEKENETTEAKVVELNDNGSTEVPVKKTPTLTMQETFIKNTKHRIKVAWVVLKCCVPIYIYIAACFGLGEIEGWSATDSFYFAIITILTVGFGDKAPVTQEGRLFACFLLPVGLIAITIVGGITYEEVSKVGKGGEKTIKQLLEELKEVIEQDDDGTVTEEEYLLFCLLQQKRVEEDELDIMRQQFQALDADGSGELDEDDVIALTAQCKKLGMD